MFRLDSRAKLIFFHAYQQWASLTRCNSTWATASRIWASARRGSRSAARTPRPARQEEAAPPEASQARQTPTPPRSNPLLMAILRWEIYLRTLYCKKLENKKLENGNLANIVPRKIIFQSSVLLLGSTFHFRGFVSTWYEIYYKIWLISTFKRYNKYNGVPILFVATASVKNLVLRYFEKLKLVSKVSEVSMKEYERIIFCDRLCLGKLKLTQIFRIFISWNS